ncbi:DUF4390 domain-containing protein [Syntrophus buswellii]|jgi:hypothetical protein|uniref:DUF4390 domain-containing protein n=1 Tax=Syntrophus TaxID=43773 RepID=UPI00345E9336
MKRRIPLLLAIVALLVIAPLLYHLVVDQNPDEMKIKDVLVTNDQTNVLVYARLSHFPPDIEKAILAGVSTTFSFKIEFYRKKKHWFDERLAQLEIIKNIKYDQAKKKFYVTSTFPQTAEAFQEFAMARLAVAEINGIPVVNMKNLSRDQDYYARIKLAWENYRLPFYAEFLRIFLSFRDFETDWQIQPFRLQT